MLFHSRNIVSRLGLLFDLLSRLVSVRNDVWNWRAMCLWHHPSYKCESPHLVWYPPAGGTLECFPNLALGGWDVSPKQYLLIRLYRLVSVTLFADNIHGLWLGSGMVRPGRPQTLGRVLTATECCLHGTWIILKKRTETGNGTGNWTWNRIRVRLGMGPRLQGLCTTQEITLYNPVQGGLSGQTGLSLHTRHPPSPRRLSLITSVCTLHKILAQHNSGSWMW